MSRLPALSILLIFLLLNRPAAAAAALPQPDHPHRSDSPPLLAPSMTWDSSIDGDVECGGGTDADECSMRRMAIAHTDYIYTQDVKGR